MRLLAAIFFSFWTLSMSAQRILEYDSSVLILHEDSVRSAIPADWVLYIHSTHKCGYCQMLRKQMSNQDLPDNLDIVFMEYDTPEDWILKADSTYLGFEVRIVTIMGTDSKVKIFPYSQLMRVRDSSVVKKYKGYPYEFWDDIFKRVGQ